MVRLGGYSFGCRVAFSAAQWLEARGRTVEVLLLDGPIDGPLVSSREDVDAFAVRLYLMANALLPKKAGDMGGDGGGDDKGSGDENGSGQSGDDVVSAVVAACLVAASGSGGGGSDGGGGGRAGGGGSSGRAQGEARLPPSVGAAHLGPLLAHLGTVRALAEAARAHVATAPPLRGRVLRVLSEGSPAVDAALAALAPNLQAPPVLAKGGHFEFFRVDADAVARAVAGFLAAGGKGATEACEGAAIEAGPTAGEVVATAAGAGPKVSEVVMPEA